MGELVFRAFDIDGNRKVDFHEFVRSVACCTRGNLQDKLHCK